MWRTPKAVFRFITALVAATFVFVSLKIVGGVYGLLGFPVGVERAPFGAAIAHADTPYSQSSYYSQSYYQNYYQGYYQGYYQNYYQSYYQGYYQDYYQSYYESVYGEGCGGGGCEGCSSSC